MESLAGDEFAPQTTYLNTASTGLIPTRAAAALRTAVTAATAGGAYLDDAFAAVEETRARYARLVGLPERRVAAGASVAVYTGLIAGSLPAGAEVLVAEGDFSSLINPFAVRADLEVRAVPLERLAEEVRPATQLVAVSAVQSADGRIADLPAIAEAARAHQARTLVDTSQSSGWLPLRAADFDFTVCVGFKWLLCPRGVAFLTVPEDLGALTPVFAGWVAGERPWDSCYGPVTELAHSARRYDESPAVLSYLAARHALAVIGELGPVAIGTHDRALADRFRTGVTELGHHPLPAPGSAIVAVPGLGDAAPALAEQGVYVSNRAGNLRAAFHLYNSGEDVDRLLKAIAALP
ncbi:class V aminotransferase [Streptomyces albus subsp. albus]|nr:class V aminotransferase [Streptomyces albus subsp. albus]